MTVGPALARPNVEQSAPLAALESRRDQRLVWAPGVGRFAAAWRPNTTDSADELAWLLPLVSARIARPITRVSLNIDRWAAAQPRRLQLPTGLVRLGWFRTLDPDTITVGRGSDDRMTLLVIPATLNATDGQCLLDALSVLPSWPDLSDLALAAGRESANQFRSP